MDTTLKPNPKYEVRSNVAGSSVKYDCLHCGVRLTSSLMEAGNYDHCPDCQTPMVVPGEKEKVVEAQKQLIEQKKREAAAQRKREGANEALAQKLADEARRARDLQLDRDPLREWIIYSVVIGLLLVFAAGRHLFNAIVTDTSGLCVVIFALFIFGVVLNFRAVKGLRSEFVCAAFLVKKLKSPRGFGEIVKAPPAGVFHQHIQDLVRIARHDPNVSQDSLMTLLYSKMMARAKIVDTLSGVLVSLGLIGTIVGLIVMTNGLSGTLDSLGESGDASHLMSGMRETMAGLGTAFYTTLVGAILGSIVLRVLNNVYASNVDHFVSYIASLTEVRITPRLRKNARDNLQEVVAGEIVE
ncbi:hypothetical protein Pla52o_13740 [Novipirellula galeiformis]|uniref:MotA/TolQ/ExbB proton channel domain-containing protein n=1 Tax=Novipirellula galeiformis TaxID=2528004 RepID=A0A5C6CN91_9BACT|nr:MotA/TolQ/ExbB proton channel family protein [Novipirellula galeiformis]TWU25077.1 hypothetical protein Pla52o_13740 [Novipirellula galeiformis]